VRDPHRRGLERCRAAHQAGDLPIPEWAAYARTADTPIPFVGCSFVRALRATRWNKAPRRATWRGGQDRPRRRQTKKIYASPFLLSSHRNSPHRNSPCHRNSPMGPHC
jgi:hypothetical protein